MADHIPGQLEIEGIPDPFALLIPDYAEDSLLVDMVARLRWEDDQVFYSHLGGWESLAEPVRRHWRERTIRDLKEATGHGRS